MNHLILGITREAGRGGRLLLLLGLLLLSGARPHAQQDGSIRGVVYDADFEAPLAAARVTNVDTGETVETSDQGAYAFGAVAPGTYTLVFAKQGYVREVETNVVVRAGELTDVDVSLAGEFVEMEEFVVQDILQVGTGTEAGLLQLRFDSPSLLDSISADFISRAGASDAASALPLVSGASVQDGKFAVIRGLPDRYVSSLLNGVRLPSADEDTRAVQLDQFPAPVLESLQVKKTFTPDQQGEASGGTVDVRLKNIPEESKFQFKLGTSYNSQVRRRNDFLTYEGGGVGFLGSGDGNSVQPVGANWDGAVGVSEGDAPLDYKWSASGGGKRVLDGGTVIGGFGSLFYERDSSYFDDGINDTWWVDNPGDPLTPSTIQGSVGGGDFKTRLFDITQGSESVQWGLLANLGVETEESRLGMTYLYTHIAEDTATLAEDTRGKQYFFPGYDPNDPSTPGHGDPDAAPYVRLETLEYTERTTQTVQLRGDHELPLDGLGVPPRLSWTVAHSTADLDQPDKRQFGSLWYPARSIIPPTHRPFKPAANFNLGNLQRIFKRIEETSDQYFLDLELPFDQWDDDRGYLKLGLFADSVDRAFNQDTFSNFGDAGASFQGGWGELWSGSFPGENHPITASTFDVDYDGKQDIAAGYAMFDLPLSGQLDVIGGARFETTDLGITNKPEADALWFPPGESAPVKLNPGDADVNFSQEDLLPSLGLVYSASDELTLRAAYSRTVARQTFKELTPIIQQEFLGGPIFVGNPELGMSALENYDLRLDYEPYAGGLFSLSWFNKDITDPIEFVQRVSGFSFTTPVNYPKGELTGWELETRQKLGHFDRRLEGFGVGANATFISSEVSLPRSEIKGFQQPNIAAPIRSRDATNAPEHLYNLYLTYDIESVGTQLSLFYTVQGDTLVAGAAESNGNFVPDLYAKQYDTLNLGVSQRIGRFFKLQFQVKNLTNPAIEEVYRSKYIPREETHTSYTKGVDFSLSLSLTL